jgi:hypothetical protein
VLFTQTFGGFDGRNTSPAPAELLLTRINGVVRRPDASRLSGHVRVQRNARNYKDQHC